MSGRRCPLPGSVVGAAARPPNERAHRLGRHAGGPAEQPDVGEKPGLRGVSLWAAPQPRRSPVSHAPSGANSSLLSLLLVKTATGTPRETLSRLQSHPARPGKLLVARPRPCGTRASAQLRDRHFQTLPPRNARLAAAAICAQPSEPVAKSNYHHAHVLFCIPYRFYLHLIVKTKELGDLFSLITR